jgi:3-oxoacyl-[acyl-carrier protein] reductase
VNLAALDLTGRTAIVTGGGRGIGKGICIALAQAGANIAVAELNPAAAETTAREIQAMGKKSLAIPTDVCSRGQIEQMVCKTVETFGTIDILVNNAGGHPMDKTVPALEMSEDIWDAVVELNLKSVFLCSQAVARVMIPRKKGSIVNLSSIAASMPYPVCIAYGVSKAGVSNLTQTLAHVLAPYNIRVNAVAPGAIMTEGAEELTAKHPEMTERLRSVVPLGHLGTPEDIAQAVVFLASDASAYIAGHVLAVDGAMPKA